MITLLSERNVIFDGGHGSQSFLIFQPVYKYFRFITNTKFISKWKYESIIPFSTSDNSLTPLIDYYYGYYIKFNGSILIQPKVTYTHKK